MSGFKVGDFKGGSNTEPRRRAAQTAKTEVATDAPPVADAAPEVPKTPAQIYRERLEAASISEAEATAVFDDVISKGYYQETTEIRGKRLVLRTRTYEDHIRSLGAVEIHTPRFQATQEELQARHNLAASLVEWNGTVYKQGKDSEKEFNETMVAIRKLPAPVYAMLVKELVKFDARMYVIFSDGAADSF